MAPTNPPEMKHGTYVGHDRKLAGEGALLIVTPGDKIVMAQFDNVKTGLGFGWHRMIVDHFDIDS